MGTEIYKVMQISDLHFGDPSGRGPTPLEPTNLWWRFLPFFDGLLGHSTPAIMALSELFLLQRPDLLIATGDLTRAGAPAEFAFVRNYLEATVTDPITNRKIGLNLGAGALERAIPGNHDHWPGTGHIRGTPWSGMLPLFGGPLPSISRPVALGNGQNLLLARLNSDAEVHPRGVARVFARGKFVSQCEQLRDALGARPAGELRLLLVHHSLAHGDWVLGIDHDSRLALHDLVTTTKCQVVLTGHSHHVTVKDHPNGMAPIRERRCGASTQYDYYPDWLAAELRRLSVAIRPLPRNSVLLHTIERESDGGLSWVTRAWDRPQKHGPFRLDPATTPHAVRVV